MALDAIVAHAREDVAARKATGPSWDGCAPSDRSLEAALRAPRTSFVLECKKASPSRGMIRAEYDPVAIARAYAAHADAISVLTNGRYFEGSHAHLRAVREAVSLPVLCKDFIVDPWQVREARGHGADAVLLMLSVLDDDAWHRCAAEAASLSVDVLTEVHTEEELARAVALDAPIIGINNRDLRTLTVGCDVTRRLAPRVPRDRVVLSESGIESHADVVALRDLCHGFLVGTSLMREPALDRAVSRLVFGVTKVCGLTRPEDAALARDAGATHGGLIFAPESPRHVTLDLAARVRAAAALEWVGVFVNADPGLIASTARDLCLSAVQLHGEESPEAVAAVRAVLPPGTEVWKAVRVRDRVPALAESGADRLVLDTWAEGARGGTGRTFDWDLLRSASDLDRSLLGGGLTPARAAAAESLGTWGLDVNSGVELAPGVKSPEAVRAFFAARRGTGRSPVESA